MARPDKLPKVLTEEKTSVLLQEPNRRYCGPHRDYLFMRVLLSAGLRAGEALALRPEHLNMTTCKLMVREGKGAKDRSLWIGDELRDEIGEWLDRRPEGGVSPSNAGGDAGRDVAPPLRGSTERRAISDLYRRPSDTRTSPRRWSTRTSWSKNWKGR